MRFRSLPLLALLAFALACAGGNTATRPANVTQPEIGATIVSGEPFFGSGSTAPATLEVRVRNTAPVPITVRRIELDSPTMSEWGFPRQTRDYSEVIEPGTSKPITFFATAQTVATRRTEPLSYRLQVYFESGGTSWREMVNVISTTSPNR